MSTKATQDLDLIQAIETRAFRAVERVLKNDHVLSRVVNKFVAWRGEDLDVQELQYSFCPWLKISPWPAESHWVTEIQHDMPIVIRIQAAVRGTKFDNLANFWNAIRLAIFPADITKAHEVQDVLRGAPTNDVVTRPEILLSAYGVITDETGLRMLIADGTVRFGLLVKT